MVIFQLCKRLPGTGQPQISWKKNMSFFVDFPTGSPGSRYIRWDDWRWENPPIASSKYGVYTTNASFPECAARVPVSLVLGVEGVFARRCVYGRNRPQPFAGGRVTPVLPCLWRVLQKWSLLEVSSAE